MTIDPENPGEGWTLTPIGRIHSCFTEKFGIPRQPGLVAEAKATLEILPPFDRREMFKGLERFSHLWLHFIFHGTLVEGWKNTVRPPWLGGRTRVGVFASRSPHRPNFLGLSVVRLLALRFENSKILLELGGIDLLDQTPVVDIKPYLPYSDRITEATSGYAMTIPASVAVSFSEEVVAFGMNYRNEYGRDILRLIGQILKQDPRPASQKETGREFGMQLWDVNVRWQAREKDFLVLSCRQVTAG
ncbi:tRNA (N6-threonylcarbamoyladenosine(37)-N6)-methyltransferase TrmO [Desulfoprunum benzoelyticum]|uniref:tRNA-Thr(GGU) m(6)t(6)A37 methyltransferase TsaA n=1 Tax=Desulfoprunum benzoelyticum TaxID=1506996 RepID=A0A840V0Z3_9BACT|nr:tRNA (N6-threonylcarbamoyladenosine(37)-N6)-methyltransferase TrmO [Desulfoprunum benzoelyticum]MBB5347480.1 tRNA-Thr(GGU) m(6)t(6)A37 methyltransferase TsaA [Desulfoprunum benzoelyticum]MBM9529642.1 tRNA (N6-threonylcarbamoyladenosine(37)-N6)-methyltransferase TrmO [Desulfoprunum benzoelyticum]